jgi:hypothetical protein
MFTAICLEIFMWGLLCYLNILLAVMKLFYVSNIKSLRKENEILGQQILTFLKCNVVPHVCITNTFYNYQASSV